MREGDRAAVVGVALEILGFSDQREDTPPVTYGDSPLNEGGELPPPLAGHPPHKCVGLGVVPLSNSSSNRNLKSNS